MKAKRLVRLANDAIEKRTLIPKPVAELPGFVTEAALAERIGLLNKKSLWRWRKLGMGPVATKIGRLIYYADKDIASWLEECRLPKSTARVRRRRIPSNRVPARSCSGRPI